MSLSLRNCLTPLVAAVAVAGAPAHAAVVAFAGSSVNVNGGPVAGDPACAPALSLSFGPAGAVGHSNLGDFAFTQHHCTTGPGPYAGGMFEYLFDAGDMLSGTYSGVLSPSDTPGLVNNVIHYVVTGGTGRFAGSSGTIDGMGTIDQRLPLPRAELALRGSLNLPAVPEPTTWSLLILGFGGAGAALRRRRAHPMGNRPVEIA